MNIIPNYIFSKFGGLSFLLVCNYNISKLPIKLSNFHKLVLLAWHLIYKHIFSTHRYFIWNNHDIFYFYKIKKIKNFFSDSSGFSTSFAFLWTKYCHPTRLFRSDGCHSHFKKLRRLFTFFSLSQEQKINSFRMILSLL